MSAIRSASFALATLVALLAVACGSDEPDEGTTPTCDATDCFTLPDGGLSEAASPDAADDAPDEAADDAPAAD